MRVWMNPASRSPWAAWLRFMKSMSIVDQGRSRLNCVCRCRKGFFRALRPRIHILDGENVCIQSTRPAQLASALASSITWVISSGVVRSALNLVGSGSALEAASASATFCALAATCWSGPGP
jgi:hypothetical protein